MRGCERKVGHAAILWAATDAVGQVAFGVADLGERLRDRLRRCAEPGTLPSGAWHGHESASVAHVPVECLHTIETNDRAIDLGTQRNVVRYA